MSMNESQVVRENEDLVDSIRASLCKKASLREDLLQEGRIALVQAARSWEEARKVQFRTYAAKLVRNAMVDFLRRQKPDCASMDEWVPGVTSAECGTATLHDLIGTPATQEDEAIENSRSRKIRRAVGALTSASRREVMSRVADGASLKEIAEERGTTPKRVHETLTRAYPELRALLSEDS